VVVVGEDVKNSSRDKSSSDNHASKLAIDAEVSFDVIVIMSCAVSRLSSLVTRVSKLAVVGKRGVLVASLVTSVAKLVVVRRRQAFVVSTYAARATKVPNVLE
jgi:hypothetical protein